MRNAEDTNLNLFNDFFVFLNFFFFGERSMSERKQTAWNKFMSSIHARWNVAQIVQRVKSDATITFDFVTLILVAG